MLRLDIYGCRPSVAPLLFVYWQHTWPEPLTHTSYWTVCISVLFIERAPIENNSSFGCTFSRYWVFVLQPCFIHAAGVNCVVRQFFSISWAVYTRGTWVICSRPERRRLCCSDNDVNTGSWGLGWLVTSGWFNRWMSVGAWNYSPAVSCSCNSTDTVAWSQVIAGRTAFLPLSVYSLESRMRISCPDRLVSAASACLSPSNSRILKDLTEII